MDEARKVALDRAFAAVADRVATPALVVDLDAVAHNVDAVIRAVGDARAWRPHVKTAKQSAIIGILLDAGVRAFKCATLDELDLVLATAAARGATDVDVLLAYPLHGPALAAGLARATSSAARVLLLADAPDHLALLDAAARERGCAIEVMLDVDVGMGRTGSPPALWRDALGGARSEPVHARIVGLHGYEGHLGWDDREAAFAGYDALVDLGEALALGAGTLVITSGTHAWHHARAHPGLRARPWKHEVSCGTVLLSDLRSDPAARELGLRQAAFVATRVIARPRADRITLDAGSKAIAPDRPAPSCAILGRPDLEPLQPSEEHMPVRVSGGRAPARGELLWLVPDHVCTTVNLYREAVYVRGDALVGRGVVEASGRTSWLGEPPR